MAPLAVRRTRPAQTNANSPLRETASQTAGPYVHIGCLPNKAGIPGIYLRDLTANHSGFSAETIRISGQVFEGDGVICKDIMLEFWQADEDGDYHNGYWARTATDLETGAYEIETAMPGSFEDASGNQLAPFINVWVVARGINIGLLTRIYFPQFTSENTTDPHLNSVDDERRQTLLAQTLAETDRYRFDIHLQGKNETVFFET